MDPLNSAPQPPFSSPVPPTPPTPTSPPKPKTNRLKVMHLSLAGRAVIFGLVAVGIWCILGQSPTTKLPAKPTEEPTPGADGTADWEEYSDPDVLGISFKYPKGWDVIPKPHWVKNELLLQSPCNLEAGGRCSKMVINSMEYNPKRPLEDYFILSPTDQIVTRGKSIFVWPSALTVEYFPGGYLSGGDTSSGLLRETKVIRNQRVYSFSCWEIGKDADHIATSRDWENDETFYRILSSVQFTTPAIDATADWETYTNEEYGFSLKYPSQLDHQVTELELDTYNNTDGKEYGYTKIFSISNEKEGLNQLNSPIKYSTWYLDGIIKEQYADRSIDQILEFLREGDEALFNSNIRTEEIGNVTTVRYMHCEQSCEEDAVIPVKNTYVEVGLYAQELDIGVGQAEEVFDQILSTFQFLN